MKKKSHRPFRSVAIFTHNKPAKEKQEIEFLEELLSFFKSQNIQRISGDIRTVSMLKNQIDLVDDEKKYDLKIAIGGDGMILKMMRTLQKSDGLILGINFGTLGFLSELTPEDALKNIKLIFKGEYHIDERMLLKCFVWRRNSHGEKEKIFRGYALNEFVLNHGGLARLCNFSVKVNRRVLSTYRSDGVIFATPTGSTGYSLSAGGPIISPSISAILITPVSPHTLTHRPIVLSPHKTIHVNFQGRTEALSLTIDGQIHFTLKPNDEVTIQKSTRTAQFIRLKQSHYFKNLRNKLHWGEKS